MRSENQNDEFGGLTPFFMGVKNKNNETGGLAPFHASNIRELSEPFAELSETP